MNRSTENTVRCMITLAAEKTASWKDCILKDLKEDSFHEALSFGLFGSL